MNKSKTATVAWVDLITHIHLTGKTYSPRGIETTEVLAHTSVVDMNFPIVNVIERKVDYNFMFTEAWWILSGRNDVGTLEKYAPSISKFSDDGKTFKGAYGPRISNQLDYVSDCLIKDASSRQAVMTIWTPNPEESKDIPCTISLQFMLRDEKLHCIATMRSSDAWIGFIYDVFVFSAISAYIKAEIIRKLNYHTHEIALGNLYLTAGSQHIYENVYSKSIPLITTSEIQILQKEVIPFNLIANTSTSGEFFLNSLDEIRDLPL